LTAIKGPWRAAIHTESVTSTLKELLMYQRILVPIDGSSTSRRGLDEAIGLARLTGGRLRLLHVLDELVFVTGFETGATYSNDVLPMLKRGGESILAEGKARVVAAGLSAETVLVECFARRTAEVVVAQAAEWKADLIVLGTHGRRGVGRIVMGSDAEQIVRSAPVPVLLVRASQTVQDSAAQAGRPAAAATAAQAAPLLV
jgi:nucleotide-binding universal stress UspA family protein